MSKLEQFRQQLHRGQIYRRSDLSQWSNAVDRQTKQLVDAGVLQKLSGGLYYYPKYTPFGPVPPKDAKLVQAFLKDHRFLLTSPNAYNTLGVGTTQLYNERVVYNHKRHGKFKLGARIFDFRLKPHFPTKMSEEFLLVDLVNNLDTLAEDTDEVLNRVRSKALTQDASKLQHAVKAYAGLRAKKFFDGVRGITTLSHAA